MLGYSAPDFTEAFRASILDNPKSLAALRETEVRWRVISGVSVIKQLETGEESSLR